VGIGKCQDDASLVCMILHEVFVLDFKSFTVAK
jgi:hypothetical protein